MENSFNTKAWILGLTLLAGAMTYWVSASWMLSTLTPVTLLAAVYLYHRHCMLHMRYALEQTKSALSTYSESSPQALQTIKHTKGEIGEILDGFNALILEAHGSRLLMFNIASTIAQHTHKVAESAGYIVQQMEHQTEETAVVYESLERLQKVFNVTVNTAGDATRIASETEAEGNKGKEVVSAAMGSVMSLSDSIGNAGDIVLQLGDQSKEISGVIYLIRKLAEQTNLLALNAAIEAARAGEQGRGFAVVADEVRSLANKTQEYTGDISRIIDSLLLMVQNADSAINETLELSRQSDELIESVVISYADLVGTLNALRDVGQNLSGATLDEANTAAEAYNKLADVRQHSLITQSIVKSVMTASLELEQLSINLKSIASPSKRKDSKSA